MKNAILFLMLVSFISNPAFADCDFSTGITAGPNKTFIYSEACHQKVGQLVQDNATKDQQIQDLTKAVQLKDLAITASDSRTALWQKSSVDEMDRLTTLSNEQKHDDWLYFGLGVLTTFAAGYTAAKLVGK